MGVCMVRHKKAAVSHLRNCVSCSLPPVCDSMCEAVLELILDKNTTYLQILQWLRLDSRMVKYCHLKFMLWKWRRLHSWVVDKMYQGSDSRQNNCNCSAGQDCLFHPRIAGFHLQVFLHASSTYRCSACFKFLCQILHTYMLTRVANWIRIL